MKKRFLFLIFLLLGTTILCMTPSAEAAGMSVAQQGQTVQALEEALFTVPGDSDSLETRVSRLERTVFGQAQKAPTLEARIVRLQKVLSAQRQPTQAKSSPAPAVTSTRNGMPSGPVSSTGPPAMSYSGPPSAAGPYPQNPTGKTPGPAYSSAMPAYPQTYQSVPSQANAQNTPSSTMKTASETTTSATPAPDETDYPTVGQMEQKLFGRTYAKEDITVRLARLEKQVFKIVQGGSLADRVDNLRLVVLGDVPAGGPSAAAASMPDPNGGPNGSNSYYAPSSYPPSASAGYSTSGYNTPGAYPYPSSGQPSQPGYGRPPYYAPPPGVASGNSASGGQPPGGDPTASSSDILAAMTQIEKDVLGKTYPTEPVNTRLDRLETKVFHTTSPELSNEDRMQRVIAVASAGGAPESGKAKAKHTFQTLLPIILTILPMVLL